MMRKKEKREVVYIGFTCIYVIRNNELEKSEY